jgi:hypothetical protein
MNSTRQATKPSTSRTYRHSLSQLTRRSTESTPWARTARVSRSSTEAGSTTRARTPSPTWAKHPGGSDPSRSRPGRRPPRSRRIPRSGSTSAEIPIARLQDSEPHRPRRLGSEYPSAKVAHHRPRLLRAPASAASSPPSGPTTSVTPPTGARGSWGARAVSAPSQRQTRRPSEPRAASHSSRD